MTPSLTPLEPPYLPAVAELLQRYPHRDGELLRLFKVFARSPRHLAKFAAGGLLDRDSPLTLAERETVILRTTANYRCEYEWGVHVTAFATAAGFSDAQVASTLEPRPDRSLWPEPLAVLLDACDELCHGARLCQATQEAVQRRWDVPAQFELFALVGFYHTVCNVAHAAQLAPEPWAARFPGAGG